MDLHKVIAGMKKEGVDCVVSEEQVLDRNLAAAEELIQNAQGPADPQQQLCSEKLCP